MSIEIIEKEDGGESVEQTVETVMDAATEIAELIDEARKEGEASEAELSHVATIQAVTLDTLNARFDGLESRLSALFDVLQDIRGAQIVAEIQEEEEAEEIAGEILDALPPPSDNVDAPTEIHVEENNGEIKVEEIPAAVVPEIRASKKPRWV